MKYWIERWVQLRKNELIAYPNEFPIANMDKVIEYIKNCPESVINNFLVSGSGC